jgi:vacuolar-type H+-ATPase subunit H
MQKVWEELKDIETKADQIESDAKEKAKQIIIQAQKNAVTLLANSQTYGGEESKRSYESAIVEANNIRKQQLEENEKAADKLKMQAEKCMDKAVLAVVNAVLEEKV